VSSKPDMTHIDVRYVAELARISLTDDEQREFQKQLDDVLAYVAQLDDLEVDGIEPMAHAAGSVNVLRDDVVGTPTERGKFIANAPAVAEDVFVEVPAVIEEEH